MPSIDRQLQELRTLVEDMLQQFRLLDAATVNGPHVDLSLQELRVVEFLGDQGPRIMRELAQFLLLAVNSVTAIVDNLVKKKIVRRQRSEEDRRIVRVELTTTGLQIYRAAVREKNELLRHMLTSLTNEEREIFMVLFRKIAGAGWSQVKKISSAG
ncbi:MAG: MarR family transcriptional regulator [Gemmataceae bacterium]